MKKLISLFFSIFAFSFSMTVKDAVNIEKTDTYNIECKIPVLKGLNPTTENNINSEINSITKHEAGILKEASEEFYDYIKSTSTSSALLPFELFCTYDVKKNDLNILSIVYETHSYTGGSHGITKRYGFNIDSKTEKRLYLQNLFKPDVDYKAVLSEMIAKKIESENSKDDDDPTKFIFFEDAEIDIEKAAFYFQGKDLVLQFPLYELAPYSSGIPEFSFPLKDIKEYLNDNFLNRI